MVEVVEMMVVSLVVLVCEGQVWYTHPSSSPTAGAEDTVGEVGPPAAVQRFAPLEGDRGAVDLAHHGARSRGGA